MRAGRCTNWPRARWEALLRACADIPVFQLGTADEAPIAGARHDFLGTPLSTAVALVANATLHLGIDSFANHLTHYRWRGDDGALSRTRGVIVWGSTQASAAGYPHNVNISLGLPCQPCFREDPKLSRDAARAVHHAAGADVRRAEARVPARTVGRARAVRSSPRVKPGYSPEPGTGAPTCDALAGYQLIY